MWHLILSHQSQTLKLTEIKLCRQDQLHTCRVWFVLASGTFLGTLSCYVQSPVGASDHDAWWLNRRVMAGIKRALLQFTRKILVWSQRNHKKRDLIIDQEFVNSSGNILNRNGPNSLTNKPINDTFWRTYLAWLITSENPTKWRIRKSVMAAVAILKM